MTDITSPHRLQTLRLGRIVYYSLHPLKVISALCPLCGGGHVEDATTLMLVKCDKSAVVIPAKPLHIRDIGLVHFNHDDLQHTKDTLTYPNLHRHISKWMTVI